MADPPRTVETAEDTSVERGRGSFTGTPLWVKVFGIVGIVVVLLVVVTMFAGGGQHGPARHTPGGGAPEVDAPGDEALPESGHG